MSADPDPKRVLTEDELDERDALWEQERDDENDRDRWQVGDVS